MLARTPSSARLGALWLGIQAVWGALLGVSLQARTSELAAPHALASYGAIAATGAAVAAVVQIAVGPFSDAYRARGGSRAAFFVVGTLAAAAAIVWFYVAGSFGALLAAFVAVQFAMNLATGPYQAVIPDYVAPQQTGVASSWMAALQSAGNALGALVASFVQDARIVAAILAGLLLSTCAVTAAHLRTLALRPFAAQRLRLSRTFADLFASRALMYVGFYTLLGYLYFYVASWLAGRPAAQVKMTAGVLLLLFTLAGVLGAVLAARPADRLDRRVVVAIFGGVFVVGLLGFIHAATPAEIGAATVLAGCGWGGFLVADWALGCEFLPASSLATAMGLWNLALILPQVVAPALTTAVLARLGALQSPGAARWAYALAVIEVLAGMAWIWRLPGRQIGCESVGNGNTP